LTAPSVPGTPAAAAAEAPPKKSLRRFLPLFLLAAVAAALLGYRAYEARLPYEWSGTVEARTIDVGSRTGGRVKDVLVREGDHLDAGQPIVVIEVGDLEAQRLMAQGQLDQENATLEKLEKGSRPEEIDEAKARSATANAALTESVAGARREQIAAANARLVAAQVTADKAKLDAERAHRLVAAGAAAQVETDDADAALAGAIAQRDAQKKTLEELENGSRREDIAQAQAKAAEARASMKLVQAGSRIEDIEAARGAVAAAKGKLDQIQVMIDELTIRSPRAARVESLDLRPGDILAPNATAGTLLEEGQLYVRIYVPETRLGLLKVGAEVPVSVDTFPGRKFKGVVEHINGVGEFSPRNLQTADERADQVFAARVGLHEGAEDLRAGMAAFITVPK
jgi:HlyD family secretion protein